MCPTLSVFAVLVRFLLLNNDQKQSGKNGFICPTVHHGGKSGRELEEESGGRSWSRTTVSSRTIFNSLSFYFVCMGILLVLFVPQKCSSRGGQKRALDLPGPGVRVLSAARWVLERQREFSQEQTSVSHLSYIPQDHLPSGLDSPASIMNEQNALEICL